MSDFNDTDSRLIPDPELAAGASRMTVPEIAARLRIGRMAVYDMLEGGVLPAIRLGRRWIITRHAYEQWERTCGMRSEMPHTTGLHAQPEVTVN